MAGDPSARDARPRGVLAELRVENLLLIERAELRLAPGLNVLTGETGAGKTVLAHALDLLLGGRARSGIVRPGAAEVYVEGVFELPAALRGELGRAPAGRRRGGRARPARGRRGPHARLRQRALGRGRRPARARRRPAGLLRPARAPPAHARLGAARHPRRGVRPRAGGDAGCLRGRARARARARGGAGRAARARRRARARARPARVRARGDRGRRPRRGRGGRAAGDARAPAPPRGPARRGARRRRGGRGARTARAPRCRWPRAVRRSTAWAASTRRSTRWPSAGARWRSRPTTSPASCAATPSASRREPGELEAVEERLAVLDRLERKHGGSDRGGARARGGVPRAARRARRRRGVVRGGRAPSSRRAREELAGHAAALRAARAARGAAAWRRRCATASRELAMDGASFEITLTPREPGPTGADAVEFLLAPTRACPPRRCARSPRAASSRGSCSRCIGAADAGGEATLVFDEVDAGIGGHDRAGGRGAAARAGGRAAGALHHPPAPDRLARGASLLDRQGRRHRARARDGPGAR